MDELIIEVLRGSADADVLRRLAEWRAASPKNEERFQAIARVWSQTEPLLYASPETEGPPVEELVIGARRQVIPLDVQTTFPRRPVRVHRLATAAALVVGLAAASAWLGFAVRRPAGPQLGVEALVTGEGELATVRLADGSVVRLGPNSRLRPGTQRNVREVWLEGRGFFAVAEDRERPFHVRTSLGEAVVLGTRFELEVRDRVMQVVVVEGTVSLEANGAPVSLSANEVGRVIEGGGVEVAKVDDVLRRVDWLADFFAFERTPLSQAAFEVGRRFGAQVEILDSALAARTVTGWYEGRSFEQTIEAVCLVVGAYCAVTNGLATIQP